MEQSGTTQTLQSEERENTITGQIAKRAIVSGSFPEEQNCRGGKMAAFFKIVLTAFVSLPGCVSVRALSGPIDQVGGKVK